MNQIHRTVKGFQLQDIKTSFRKYVIFSFFLDFETIKDDLRKELQLPVLLSFNIDTNMLILGVTS